MSLVNLDVGADGRARCPWGTSTADYIAYHDTEWGLPVRDEHGLYERLVLEGFQSGLSWLTILRKREAFRTAFSDFDPRVVSEYDERDVTRLLGDAGIVRNAAKIRAAVTNARATVALQGALPQIVWSHQPRRPPRAPRSLSDVPATTAESVALSKSLKKHGFAFVGPTTAYALMQACGLVDDHLRGCWRRGVAG
ncbi:MAG: DNA-3-methyladenine glycosylase [Frankiaceae bacterium]|nr:DNA-3-methyladenine glycosylase [Frankiaceae bacterium]